MRTSPAARARGSQERGQLVVDSSVFSGRAWRRVVLPAPDLVKVVLAKRTAPFDELVERGRALADDHGTDERAEGCGALSGRGEAATRKLTSAVRSLLVVVVLTSVAFGLVEIGVVAFARAAGHAWGVPEPSAGPRRQLFFLLSVYALGVAPLGLLGSPWSLGALLLLGQGAVAALLAAFNALAGRLSPPGMAVESYTWLSTGNFVGTALGNGDRQRDRARFRSPAVLSGAALPALAALVWVAVRMPSGGDHRKGPADLRLPAATG